MGDGPAQPRESFKAYVGYGLAACILLAIPLVAIDWLLKNLPFLGAIADWLDDFEQPAVAVLVGVVVAVVLLGLMGWVLRRFLWERLSRAPVIGTLMTSSQQFAKAMASIDRTSRELVVWMQLFHFRTLAVIVSRTRDSDETEFATLYVLNGAGQFQGNQICSVRADTLVYPGWTVDEAIVFSSSGGAVVPEGSEPVTGGTL